MNINWFPGHMKKTREQIEKDLKLVDLVVEVRDARIPLVSQNPLLEDLTCSRPKLVILNKSDLADPSVTKKWERHLSKSQNYTLSISANNPKDIQNLINKISSSVKENQKSSSIRAMIVGIPNSGKSTIINSLSGKKGTKTGNKPGVTKTTQWIKVNEQIRLLDTPGILWHKFDTNQGLLLAFTGAIKDEILDIEQLSLMLIKLLREKYPDSIEMRYKIDDIGNMSELQILELIGRKRGAKLKGDEIDYEKTAGILINEFRKGILGRISLEEPPENE